MARRVHSERITLASRQGEVSAYGRNIVEIMGVAEIAALLGISRQRVHQLSASEGFPAPYAQLQAGTFWRRSDILAWMRTTGRTPRVRERKPPDDDEV